MSSPIFDIQELSVGYRRRDGSVNLVVSEVTLDIHAGEIVGLAGESGSGKSTLALTAIGYRASNVVVAGGRATVAGHDSLGSSRRSLRHLWGRRIAYVSQNAATALNPARRIGAQLIEPLKLHLGLSGAIAATRALDLLEEVGLPRDPSWLRRYPHELSGGQQQRVALALALACEPQVLVLDEPTTGLDVTTQAHVASLLRQLVSHRNVGVLFVSHDLALISTLADRLAVMYAGQIVETGTARELCAAPRHPYSAALLAAVPSARRKGRPLGIPGSPPGRVVSDACAFAPRCPHATAQCETQPIPLIDISEAHLARCIHWERVARVAQPPVLAGAHSPAGSAPLIEVAALHCTYRSGRRTTHAVSDVSFTLDLGATLGVVGESGSGKSTLVRAIAGLHPPASGTITYRGQVLASRALSRPRQIRKDIQLVFQNPDSSLNPRHTVSQLLTRPLRLFAAGASRQNEKERIRDLLELVKLPAAFASRYPAELSGGEKQRVALARAFAGKPSMLLCDEVTSGLDVSVQASIIELIAEVAEQSGTAVLLVSHDLGVVRSIASHVLVMRNGEVCEGGRADDLFATPRHPYTAELLDAIPQIAVTPSLARATA